MRMGDEYLTLAKKDDANRFNKFLLLVSFRYVQGERASSSRLIGSYFCVHVFCRPFALLFHLNEHRLLVPLFSLLFSFA